MGSGPGEPRGLFQLLPGADLRMNFHPGQWRAWESAARFVAVLAGTQGGKTSFGPYWLIREMARRGPGDALVVTPTFPLLEVKLLVEFLRLFERQLGLGAYSASPARRFTFSPRGMRRLYGASYDPARHSPSRVLFGYASDPESLESSTAVCAWCDEAGQRKFRLEAWQAVLRRLSLARGRALITTSIYGHNWLKARYDAYCAGDRDWEFVTFDSTLNPAFPKDEYERARRDLPKWRFDMLYRGRFTRPAGLIYDCFDSAAHRCPRFVIPRDWKRHVGLDFGEVNMAAVFLAEEAQAKRFYVYRTYREGGKSVPAHVRALLHGEPRLPWVVGGSASENDWRQEFRNAGLPVRAPSLRDVEVGIDRVYGLIQSGRLIVFDDLAELREELATYSRVLNDKGEPTSEIEDKASYHLLDALRYVLGDLSPSGPPRIQTATVDFYA